MIANNRLHMANLLEDRMNRSWVSTRDGETVEGDSSQIKTFLLEALLPEEATPDRTAAFIETLFPRSSGKKIGAIVLSRAKDDTVTSIQTFVAGHPIHAYLDFTNPRFWLLHSTSKSESLDRLVSHWIDDLPELDRAWFPVGLLDRYSEFGTLRGIGLEYNNEWIKKGEFNDDGADVFKMQLRSGQAKKVLATLRGENGEPNVARLSKVSVKAIGNSVSDIKYDGKITGHGKSFQEHLAVTHKVYDQYTQQIRLVEDEYAMSGSFDGTMATLSGSPITFNLHQEIQDLPHFCDGMFSGGAPFRLWGDPVRVSEKYYRVCALDLHSARTVGFELTTKFIRAYLPKGSCGNSILRLYTNLQARYDAQVTVVNGDGDLIFGF